MNPILEFCLYFFLVAWAFHLLTRKYLNPYKLTMVFGKKGSGKSTLMVRMAYEYLSRGWTVFCTERLDGCVYIDYNDIGIKHIPPYSLLLVDEVGMIWDNRNFKQFKPEVRDWFKLQRHYKVKVVLFSQTFDIDKKLRDLTDDMYLCCNMLRVFSWAKRITRRVVLVQPGPDTPARIDEELAYDSLIFWPFGSRILTFIPRWAPYFDSHNCPKLKEHDWQPEPELKIPRILKKSRKKASKRRKSKHMSKALILLRSINARLINNSGGCVTCFSPRFLSKNPSGCGHACSVGCFLLCHHCQCQRTYGFITASHVLRPQPPSGSLSKAPCSDHRILYPPCVHSQVLKAHEQDKI